MKTEDWIAFVAGFGFGGIFVFVAFAFTGDLERIIEHKKSINKCQSTGGTCKIIAVKGETK